MRIAALLLIVALGFLLRLAGLWWGQGYSYFEIGDQIDAYRVARNFLNGEATAQYIGQPSFKAGRVPGPLWAMFWSTPLRWGGSPNAVTLLIILLNTASIPLVYVLADRLLGAKFSLWAALFYATAPWPVYYSVGASNHLVLAPLGALLVLALWNVSQRPESPHIFSVCLLLAAIPQFHMIGVFYVPAAVVIIALSPSRISRKWLAAGLVAAAAIYLPYIFGEIKNNWANTRAIFGGESGATAGVLRVFSASVNALSSVVNRWTGYHFSDYRQFGDAMFGSFYVLAFFNALSIIYCILFFGSFIMELVAAMRGQWLSPRAAYRAAPAVLFVAIILLLPPLLFIPTGHGYNTRYAIIQFPCLFILPALFIVNRLSASPWRKPLLAGVVVMIIFNCLLSTLFYAHQGRHIETADYFIPNFRKMDAVYHRLQAQAGPAARIRIDPAPYTTGRDGEPVRGARTLADYVNLREEIDRRHAEPTAEKLYRVVPRGDVTGAPDRVAYEGNGIALVAAP